MPTAEQRKLASRKLSHWIENEKRVVTYRDVSREVGCHVNVAKNILLDHYNGHPSLCATYLLTGPLLSTSTLKQTVIETGASPSKASQSLLHLGGTQKVIIRDMDEMSEGDRNSEDEYDPEEGLELEVGNDKGALEEALGGRLEGNGISGGRKGGAVREDEVTKPEEVRRWGVVLVEQEGLEEKKGLFEAETLNVHIYALSPSPVNDPAQYLISTLSLRDHPNYQDSRTYGTISGSAAGAGASTVIGGEKQAMRDGAMDWGKKKVEPKKADSKLEAEAKKGEVKKVAAPLAVATAPSGAASSSINKAAKASQSSKKKRVVQSDTESDEDPQTEKATSSAGAGVKKGEIKVEPTSSMVRAEDTAAMEAMMGMDMDVDLSDKEDVKPDLKELERKSTGDGKRKRRRVKKTVQEIDAKGYMVTKDHWSDESYSGDSEPDTQGKATTLSKSKTASKPPLKGRESTASLGSSKEDKKPSFPSSGGGGAKGAKSGTKPTGQSTLKGFFIKK